MRFARAKAAGLGLAAIAAAYAAPAYAAPFDGSWSVLIVTESGSCEVYRFGVQVANGRVAANDSGTRLNGTIANSGAVNLNLSRGADTARVTGKVSGGFGRGRWTSPSRQCSGRWEADKRS
ncbi:MAG: uncharacterized protein JWN93_1278 [Hyphomicrobiales bacterium]|nr:uncharacterized protein [Hyphomicrobiales bacterium]